MRRKKTYITIISLIACVGSVWAQDFFDDIYYNPKNDKSVTTTTTKKDKQSSYIANMADMDVDAYNRRGAQYYVSQIDTIGSSAENGEDFVYTQQIQKYYNPTIVVENANNLVDVLTNAYGNVDIVINNNGYPVFAPYYGWNWPYYSSVWSPWYWGFNIGPFGWSVGWYDPWYAWGWGPSWGWGPGWGPSWGWGPGWGLGPGPGPGPGWRPGPMATWSPTGNRTVGPRPGWSGSTQPPRGNMVAQGNRPPVGNYNGGTNPGGYRQPAGMPGNNSRPAGVVNNDGRWQYNTSATTGHRVTGTGVLNRPGNQPNVSTQQRPSSGTNNNAVSNSSNSSKNTNANRNINTTRTPSRQTTTGSRNTGGNRSFGSGGGSRGTGGRSGGGGGGRHR